MGFWAWGINGLFLIAMPALASYRLYKLKVIHFNSSGKITLRVEQVTTTLDPHQYEHFHAGFGRMRVEMLDTWYCPGDTRHFRKYCKKPQVKDAYANLPTRVHLPYNRQPIIP